MSPELFEQVLAMILRHTSIEDQQRLADELRARTRATMLRRQAGMIRDYRARFYCDVSEREAARQIERDFNRFASGPMARLVIPPVGNPKQLAIFEILGTGPLLGSERIRQILRALG